MTSLRCVLALTFGIVVLGVPAAAEACSCVRARSTCEAAARTDAVFAATVSSITDREPSAGHTFLRSRRVRVRITETFRGELGDTADVFTGLGGGDCGYAFAVGKDYLIYAHLDPETGALTTGICSRTAPLGAARGDVAFLRGPARAPGSMGTITGQVEHIGRRDDGDLDRRPLAGVRVTAVSGERTFTAVTDRSGEYELSVTVGAYEVRMDVRDGIYANPTTARVEVFNDRDCGRVNITVRQDGRISGRLVDAQGAPVPFFPVELVPVKVRDYSPSLATRTDARGRYEFDRLASGTFHVAANSRQHPRGPSIAPRVLLADQNGSPTVITVAPEGRSATPDFVLPRELVIVRLEGRVLAADGVPQAGAHVDVSLEAQRFGSVGPAMVTDHSGRFVVSVVSGYRYQFTAERFHLGLMESRAETAVDAAPGSRLVTLQLQPVR